MKILLTGATGYIAQRLLPVLLEKDHQVVCAVRDKNRFNASRYPEGRVTVVEADLLNPESLQNIPEDIDVAYYLVHSMSGGKSDFNKQEKTSAENFIRRLAETRAKQVIYLGGIVNDAQLSKHLSSRKAVEEVLGGGRIPLTTLRAGIIVGSGSASFEIIRDLVEKLPVMIAPRWLKSKCQPVSIRNVIEFLSGVLGQEKYFNRHFDIYGPDTLTYKQMLLRFAAVRGLKRRILVVPVMTPRLSSYWLYFVTSTSYALAKNLVDSMKVNVVGEPNDLASDLGIRLIPYDEAIRIAFEKVEQNMVLSSWKDALSSNIFSKGLSSHIQVPGFGTLTDNQTTEVKNPEKTLDRIFSIGGASGWYYGNWLWRFRGLLDKVFGGVGLRRGRRNKTIITAGETLDFWRVLYASREEKRLLLYAEMKIPGEAWLEFRITKNNCLKQTATFRPLGLLGRMYWYSMLPFHFFLFRGMIRKLAA